MVKAMTEVQAITDLYEIYFPKLGWRFNINPTAFTVFGLEIQWYGIIIATGLLLAMLFCFPKMKRFGLDGDRAIDAVIGGVVGGIVGARAFYVICSWKEYSGDWKSIFDLRSGGLAIYGGLIGAVTIGIIICKIRKVRLLPMLDISVIGFLIGQGIGRWGNFVNQEAFGTNTDSLFGMTGGTIQHAIASGSVTGADLSEKFAVHPCFLYESVWCLLGFILLAWYSKRRKYDGQLLLIYLTWYGAERFVVESLRTDSLMYGSLRVSQAISAVFVVTSLILQIIMYSKVKRDPERFILYCNSEESKRLLEEAEKNKLKKPEKNSEQNNSENKTEEKNDFEELSENENNDHKIIQEDIENGSDN